MNSKTRKPLSDNINSLGELLSLYGPYYMAHTVADMILKNYDLPYSIDHALAELHKATDVYMQHPEVAAQVKATIIAEAERREANLPEPIPYRGFTIHASEYAYQVRLFQEDLQLWHVFNPWCDSIEEAKKVVDKLAAEANQ